jgi:16S rRNA U516 pseudouridylate synthase RsuA-like enzyme
MDKRYSQYSDGVTDFEFWNVVVDEIPAIVAQCEKVPDQLKVLIREARKVRIRLILLTQGAEVKALKMEGEGSIRDSLTFIRLGNFATDHARKLKDKSLLAWLQQSDRPCLVDDLPAIVPNLGH